MKRGYILIPDLSKYPKSFNKEVNWGGGEGGDQAHAKQTGRGPGKVLLTHKSEKALPAPQGDNKMDQSVETQIQAILNSDGVLTDQRRTRWLSSCQEKCGMRPS